jgi:hypothetical protein
MTKKRSVLAADIQGGVWSCAPVSERPELVLTDWRVFEVLLPGSTARTRHYIGYNTSDREGRVSSAIVMFDPAAMCGVTKSDRVYELRGRSGWNGDADYTWNRWKHINSATDVVDVTAEVVPRTVGAIEAALGGGVCRFE